MTAQNVWLCFTLESAATFGRGDGIPGLVDREVTTDGAGCPYLHGRTLKGLLGEACADVLYALRHHDSGSQWAAAADSLFGVPGSTATGTGKMRVGHARLPEALRTAIAADVARKQWTRDDVVEAITGIRRQTAIDANGAPEPHTLRSMRVILRATPFEAQLSFDEAAFPVERGLLAACVLGFRRAGTARNRGRGRLSARLENDERQDVTGAWYALFREEVCS